MLSRFLANGYLHLLINNLILDFELLQKTDVHKLSGEAYIDFHDGKSPRRFSVMDHGTAQDRKSHALRMGTQKDWASVFPFFNIPLYH